MALNTSIPQLSLGNESDRLHFAKLLLATQVDDVNEQPWMEVRVPKEGFQNEKFTKKLSFRGIMRIRYIASL